MSVDNDANCATLAEHRVGAGIGATDLVLVTLGTGIGGGVIAGGELQRGAAGFAGEPGHMVVDPNGPPCPCGRRGCWERYASGSGLGRLARDAAHVGRADAVVALAGGDPEDVRGEHVTTAAADGDADAIEVLRDFAWWVALGVSNLENLLDPEVVVIGGGLAEAGELLLAPTREAYATLVLGYEHRPPVRIVGAELGAGRRCHRRRPDRPGLIGPRSRPPRSQNRAREGRGAGVPLARMEFRRITSLPPYVFTIIDTLKIEARRAGADVIDLGFGNPDFPSPDVAVEKLAEAVHNPRNHRYSSSRGIPKLREAVRRPLPAPVRRRARPRDRGHQHHRRQGGVLAPDVDAAAAG